MKHKNIYSIFLILVLIFISCDSLNPTNKRVRKYFESWEGIWEIQSIKYVDKDTSFLFDSVKPQIEFSPCQAVIRNDGGMCTIQLVDQQGNVNELWAIGSYIDEDERKGSLRLDYSPNTQFANAFNDSLLAVGEFSAQQFSDGTATISGGRIANFEDGDPFFSRDVIIELARK